MRGQKGKVVKRTAAWISVAILLTVFLLFWIHGTEGDARYTPEYERIDIGDYLNQEVMTDEDYKVLFRQTGLSPLAVDTLRGKGQTEQIFQMQERFFAEVQVCCEREFLLFNEVLALAGEGVPLSTKAPQRASESRGHNSPTDFMPVLENGDILITFNSHFLGWRNGHAAIVIDAENEKTLEALSLGTDSTILSISSWYDCPSFAVLRLTAASKEQRAEVAAYAEENLAKLPYRLTAGIGSEEAVGTQCAHLVWYAYNQFGYDLDSDGGMIVTPKDIYNSSLLDVVQIYGMNPEDVRIHVQ